VGKPEGKRLCGRPRHRWKDYINIDFKETGWECVKWFRLAQDKDHLQAEVITITSLKIS
jgi:hypothetical protein